MNKQIIRDEALGEQYSVIHHSSGLDIYIWKMEGYQTTDAMFVTKYGSFNNIFKSAGEKDYTTVPEGIAHFLEHKLFENEDCTAFELYAQTGADANAYTTFDHTAYLFSCSQNWDKSLEILLSFVRQPYFTQESIDKELGIIGQEIRMCLDSPERMCFFNLLKALYSKHPIMIDVVGTEESIAKITPELLYSCYDRFYDLNNMFLAIAGNVDEDKVIEIADRLLSRCEDKKTETLIPEEPREVAQKRIEADFPIGLPLFSIGFKAPPFEGEQRVKMGLACMVAMELMTGTLSPLYNSLLEQRLVNQTFGFDVMSRDGIFFVSVSGESTDPDRVYELCVAQIERSKREGFDQRHFEMIRKAAYAAVIRELSSPEMVCSGLLTNSAVTGVDAFCQIRALRDLTAEDCRLAVEQLLDAQYSAISIVNPKQ